MNKANIDKLIAWLKADAGQHFHMSEWVKWRLPEDQHKGRQQEYCDTTFCLAGHCGVLRQMDGGVSIDTLDITPRGHFSIGQDYLDLKEEQAYLLFLMYSDEEQTDGQQRRNAFDALPDCHRVHAAIRVLQHLRDTGKVDWDGAIEGKVGDNPNANQAAS